MNCKHLFNNQIGQNHPFTGPVSTTHENPAAHGGVSYTVECVDCGAQRQVNQNRQAYEYGPWSLSRAERLAQENPAPSTSNLQRS